MPSVCIIWVIHFRPFTPLTLTFPLSSPPGLQIILRKLTQNTDEVVEHALKVRKAWANCKYFELFKLYKNAPKMSSFVMDWFINRERKKALKRLIKA